jgi:DNA-binding transcriptional LysR family regulator
MGTRALRKPGLAFDVRLADVLLFLAVKERGSVTAAAKALGTTASHVSKALARLEGQLRTRLLARSGRGVVLTKAALQVLPDLSQAAESLTRARRGQGQQREVTVAAPSYLLHSFLPPLAAALRTTRVRGIQMGTGGILASLGSHQFDVAFSTGESSVPAGWKAAALGSLRAGLFCMPSLARQLGKVTVEALRAVPFITPVSFLHGQWEPMSDGCPLSVNERLGGHEAPTISLALAIAAENPQLAFGPAIAAADLVRQRKLVELVVPGWHVASPLFLAVDIDRITIRDFSVMAKVAERLASR